MSKTNILCHIVFATKARERTIFPEKKRELYAYIYGIIKNKKCEVIRINGTADHIHLLIDLHPSIALSDLVKAIKQNTTNWIKQTWILPQFDGWAKGYYAGSIGVEGKDACRQYIINQEEHHRSKTFLQEMEWALMRRGLEVYKEEWE